MTCISICFYYRILGQQNVDDPNPAQYDSICVPRGPKRNLTVPDLNVSYILQL